MKFLDNIFEKIVLILGCIFGYCVACFWAYVLIGISGIIVMEIFNYKFKFSNGLFSGLFSDHSSEIIFICIVGIFQIGLFIFLWKFLEKKRNDLSDTYGLSVYGSSLITIIILIIFIFIFSDQI